MKNGWQCPTCALEKRITALEKRLGKVVQTLANEVADLKALKTAVDAHNAADEKFQTDVNQKVADLEAAVAGGDTAAIDAAIEDLKTSVGAMPTLTVPA